MTSNRQVFSLRMRKVVVVLVWISAAFTLVALLKGAQLAQPRATAADSFGNTSLGHGALFEVLGALGVHVSRGRNDDFAERTAPLWVIDPAVKASVGGNEHTLVDLLGAREQLGHNTLVVLPKWEFNYRKKEATPATGRAQEVLAACYRASHPELPDDAELPVSLQHPVGDVQTSPDVQSVTGSLGRFRSQVPWSQTLSGEVGEILLALDEHVLVSRFSPTLVVVSDPDLIANWNLQRQQHGALLAALARIYPGDTLVVDELFHGHGRSPSLASAMGEYPTVLLTAQLILVLLLAIAMGAARFGPPAPDFVIVRGPAQSIQVGAAVLAEGRPPGRLAYSYLTELLRALAGALGLENTTSPRSCAKHIDQVSKRRGQLPVAERLWNEMEAKTEGSDLESALSLAGRGQALRRRMFGNRNESGDSQA